MDAPPTTIRTRKTNFQMSESSIRSAKVNIQDDFLSPNKYQHQTNIEDFVFQLFHAVPTGENMSEKDLHSILMKIVLYRKTAPGRKVIACWADFINFPDIERNTKHDIAGPFK